MQWANKAPKRGRRCARPTIRKLSAQSLPQLLQQLRPRHAERRVVRTRRHALRLRDGEIAVRVAQIARRRFQMPDAHCPFRVDGVLHLDFVPLVGQHENTAVRTIRRTQPAPDAVVLDDDLLVPSAMDRIHRTTHHAMRVRTRAATRRHDVIAEAHALAHQPRDAHAVRMMAVFLDASARALVATRAAVQVQHKDALPLVKPLFDVLVERVLADLLAPQPGQ